jgi:hypothetical protein
MITPSYVITATERVLPRLALDFVTGVLDPRVTVLRALNTATAINSSGFVAIVNANLPRFDYDPVTLAPKGILIEEQRTNLVTFSEQFDNAAWSKLNASIAANATAAPDGTATADLLVPNTTLAQHRVDGATTIPATAHTWSCFVKAAGYGFAWLRIGSSGAVFDLSTGAASSIAPGVTVGAQAFANGWWRFSVSVIAAGNDAVRINVLPTLSTTNFAGDGTSGIFIWGAQLEAGDFATSYIPTVASQVTRTADVVSMTGTNFSDWYNAGAGSWFIQTDARNGDTILTAGGFTLTADATALKKYADSYSSDQSASSLVIGNGTVAKLSYYKQALLAAELQALRA